MSRSAPLDDKMRRALELWEKITDERLRGSVARAISANDFDLALSLAEARRPSAGVSNGLAAVAEEEGDEEAEAANGTYRQAAPPADAWACSACSFENHGGTHCAMCGTQRAGAPGRSRGAATLRGMASTPGTSGRRAGIVGGGLVAVAEDAGLVFEEEGEEEEGEEEDDDDQMLADLGMTPRGHNMPPANSHTILVIDNSASMKQRDVKNTDKRAPADVRRRRGGQARCEATPVTRSGVNRRR